MKYLAYAVLGSFVLTFAFAASRGFRRRVDRRHHAVALTFALVVTVVAITAGINFLTHGGGGVAVGVLFVAVGCYFARLAYRERQKLRRPEGAPQPPTERR